MDPGPVGPLYFTGREQWRDWLKAHHTTESEIWLLYYKKHTGKPRIPYDDAVEEALCYGWIDGKVRTIDDERFMQRYTPRQDRSIWSKLNRERAERMIAEGKMTGAGLAKIVAAKASGEWDKAYSSKEPPEMPQELKEALEADGEARALYDALPPSQKLQYLRWVDDAKREETRRRRAQRSAEYILERKRPGI